MKLWVAALFVFACGTETPVAKPPPQKSLFEEEAKAPPSEPSAPAGGALQFDDTTQAWGVEIKHHAGRNPDRWIPEITTGGVALLDVDRNGALDILVPDGGNLAGELPAGAGPRLLLGDGKGGFTDATQAWGLTHAGYGMGIAAGDIDGDGWVDVYLTTFDEKDRLLRNNAGTKFEDVTQEWKIKPRGWSTSAAFADVDADGDLDLYVVRYVDYALESAIKCYFRKIHVYCTPGMYEPLSDLLYRNDGTHFVDISKESGVSAHAAKGLAIATGDLDSDGDADFYVADDISRNLLFLGDGKGSFTETGVTAGVAYSELGREEASMGVAVSDSDEDALWDLAVTNFQSEPTSLYTRRESGTYRERSDAAGIGASARARLSFGIEFLDADNDGDDDLITGNGHVSDNVESYRESVVFAQLNSLYERVSPGKFTDVSSTAGSALKAHGVTRGLAVGDLDGDGGVDYVAVNNDGAVQIGRNVSPNRGHWLSLWLEGSKSNRSAIGAVVTMKAGERTVRREVRGATSYLSVSDRRVHVGLGEATKAAVTIRWPDGTEQDLGTLDADAHLHVVEGGAAEPYTPGAKTIPP